MADWSEFIAQYYAVKLIDEKSIDLKQVAEFITRLFHDVTVHNIKGSKDAFAMICAYWFNCTDFNETYAALSQPGAFMPEDEPYGNETQNALRNCIEYIHEQMQKDRPWEINEDFIYELGFLFSMFRTVNSLFMLST